MGGTWTTVEIAGKPADVYEPARPRYGLLHLHDLDGATLSNRPAFTALFDELRLACVCPHGGRSWWADRVCPEFNGRLTAERHVVDNVLPWFESRWGLRPRAVGLDGVGMGGQGALRIAFKRPELFPVVAALAPAVDMQEWYGRGTPLDEMYDSKEHCRQDTATLHIHPSRYPPHIFFCVDPEDEDCYRGCDRLHEKLNALGGAHTADLATRGGGHSWEYFERMAGRALRFVAVGLEEEARRLL